MPSLNSVRIRAAVPFLVGAAALFQGCLRNEPADETPPEYTIANLRASQGKWRFGVTDTIAVEFGEKVDTSALEAEFDPAKGIAARFAKRDRLLIYGTETGSGLPHFPVGEAFAATLRHIRDDAGNGVAEAKESFVPYPWLDRDFTESGYAGFDSLFADDSSWADGSPFSDTLISEGNLDAKTNGGLVDYNDIKLIKLVPPDTFTAVLTCPKSVRMRLELAGPFPADAESLAPALEDYDFARSGLSDSTQSKGRASVRMITDYGKHDDLLGSSSEPGIYALRMSVPLDYEAFYRLETSVRRKKRP